MRVQNYIYYTLLALSLFCLKTKGQCPKVQGTIQLSDTVGIKATEITVYDYVSFIAANNYDTTLFPTSSFLDTVAYKDLFTDLRNRTHDRFLKSKGKGSYTSYFKSVKGSKANRMKVKTWLELPVGGILRSQADAYCKWLENFYNQFPPKFNRLCYYEIRLASEEEVNSARHVSGVKSRKVANGQTSYRFVAFVHPR